MSLTIFREGDFRFFFFSREEPRMHVHVYHSDGEAKFWLEPVIELAQNFGLSAQLLQPRSTNGRGSQMARDDQNTRAIDALETRIAALEGQLNSLRWAGKVGGFVILAIFGAAHLYEVPRIAIETFDKKINEQMGAQMLSRMKDLKTEFDHLSSAEQVATARVLEGAKEKFAALDAPYLIVWDYSKDNRWNLDINGGVQTEGRTAGISNNGIQKWKIVPDSK